MPRRGPWDGSSQVYWKRASGRGLGEDAAQAGAGAWEDGEDEAAGAHHATVDPWDPCLDAKVVHEVAGSEIVGAGEEEVAAFAEVLDVG